MGTCHLACDLPWAFCDGRGLGHLFVGDGMNEAMKCDRCGKMVDAVYPHTCTPLALRLADALQAGADDPMWADHCEMSKRTASLSAAELRRLHAEVEELRGALDEAMWRVKYKELKAVNESHTALLRQALEALERGRPQIIGVLVKQDQDAAITALRERLGEKT
jgi:hypothetical protein